jgi:LPXTG-site transpeptidase (sortase) family protein
MFGAALAGLAILLLGLVTNMVILSPLSERAAQQRGFDTLRNELALGTAPVSQTGSNGALLPLGTPVAILNIPQIGLSDEVVSEGTTPAVMMRGPGHRRDTVLPGQQGVCVIYGRQAAYGGPFARLGGLPVGDTFTATTGQGTSTYRVIDHRVAGDLMPPAVTAGQGRITFVTAIGTPFVPDRLLYVDAQLMTPAQPTPAQVLTSANLTSPELELGTDTSTIWKLVLWMQALIAVILGGVWAWYRWGRWQTWIVFAPITLLVGLYVSGQVTLLLPNLI